MLFLPVISAFSLKDGRGLRHNGQPFGIIHKRGGEFQWKLIHNSLLYKGFWESLCQQNILSFQ